jgi:hypothetical protein
MADKAGHSATQVGANTSIPASAAAFATAVFVG